MTSRRGRPTSFQPIMVPVSRKLAEMGSTFSEIAKVIEVDVRTLYRWRRLNPEFDEALRLGVEAANRDVESSLFKQAIGYWNDAEEIKVVCGRIVRVKVRRFILPSPSATIFWLKAKAGWRDDGLG